MTDADISPDGKEFAVVREIGRLQRLEFPVGKLILETEGWILVCSIGGAPKEVQGSLPGEIPLEWEGSGKAPFLWDRTWPARVIRLELESGRRSV